MGTVAINDLIIELNYMLSSVPVIITVTLSTTVKAGMGHFIYTKGTSIFQECGPPTATG